VGLASFERARRVVRALLQLFTGVLLGPHLLCGLRGLVLLDHV
jgi:hypothetical protein